MFQRLVVPYLVLAVGTAGCAGETTPGTPDAGKKTEPTEKADTGTTPGMPILDSGTGQPRSVDGAIAEGSLEAGADGLPQGLVLPPDSGRLEVEIGISDFSSGLGFGEFEAGGGVPIAGLGQAGLTARLAVRVREVLGVDLSRVFIRVQLVNVKDKERMPGLREFEDPDPMRCENGWCYSTSIRVEISHLAKLPELEGTLVRIQADATAEDDPTYAGTSYSWGYFEADN